MAILLPKLYPILDSGALPQDGRADFLDQLARSLADSGVLLLEYRNKTASDAEVLAEAGILRAALPQASLVLDDRVDVALAAGFNGVHVDTGDLPPALARSLMGERAIVGTSAGSDAELSVAVAQFHAGSVDYIAFGPIFPTTTKRTSAPPIGIDGVRRFRAAAGPEPLLVAAAGITLASAPAILEAGANAVAVSAALFQKTNPAAEFERWMAALAHWNR